MTTCVQGRKWVKQSGISPGAFLCCLTSSARSAELVSIFPHRFPPEISMEDFHYFLGSCQSWRLSEAVGARTCRCVGGNKRRVRKRCSELAEWDRGLSNSRGALCPELDIWGRSLIYGVTLTVNIKQNLRAEWAH